MLDNKSDIFTDIADSVSNILNIDITEISDIELVENQYYVITVGADSYTYNYDKNELQNGIVVSANKTHSLTEEEKERIAAEDMNLIHYVLKGVNRGSIPYEDLYSVGSLGFAKALNGYRKNKNTKFSTFAVYCIKNEIFFYLKKEQKHMQNLSLNQALSTDSNGHELVLGDVISEEDVGRKSLEEIFYNSDLRDTLITIIKKLSPLEQEIVLARYGLGVRKKTQQELAQELEMTQANISKIQQSCLKKMHIYLKIANQRVNAK